LDNAPVRRFSSPEETNARFKYLMTQGQTGLSVAYDLPALMGLDADSPLSEGEVGKCGVAVSSLSDFETLFDGIPLEQVTVSQTINAPASIFLAMYLVVAEKQGADFTKISGTLQNDILKEYIAQKEWIYPIKPAMKLVIDTFEYCIKHVPKYNPISVSGYHIREAGATALQELAFTLRDGVEYVQYGVERGLDVDEFVPRISFFFNAHNDFFEEIAKYRAARVVWAKTMKERFGSKNPRTMQLRFHTQTAGVSLTVQQPLNNIARVAIQALAGVLGGTQSLHTDAYDEALALPTDQAALIALRTQQIIAEAVEAGFPQREIQESAYQYQKAVERSEQTIVGVNKYRMDDEFSKIEILQLDENVREHQLERLEHTKKSRDKGAVANALEKLKKAAQSNENTMPAMIEAVKSYATVEEISVALRDVYGIYEEPAF
jgi:methylmalonyl-CoA mutase N-terminal domain/subunit